jgi:hypothetical protein
MRFLFHQRRKIQRVGERLRGTILSSQWLTLKRNFPSFRSKKKR